MGFNSRAALTLGALALLAAPAWARPEYAASRASAVQAEAKPADGDSAKKTGPPAFKAAWKADVPDGSMRIGVGDTVGDKKTRLLVLGAGGALTVYKPAADSVEKEATIQLGDPAGAAKFVVGKFAKDKPALIAIPGALFYRDGDGYAKKLAPDLTDITGAIRFTDGAENIFYFGGGGMPDVYAVDLSAANPLVAGREIVMPDQGAGVYSSLIAHAPPELLAGIGLPEEAQKPGVAGGFDPRGDGKFYGFVPWTTADGSYLAVIPADSFTPMGGAGDVKPIWKSSKLGGKVLDLAYGQDPRDGKLPGLYVLETAGADNKQRVVEFFALD